MSEPAAAAADTATEEQLFYHEASLNAAWTGARLAIGALAFLFGAFVFAYFYLRSLNPHGMWKPAGFIPPHLWAGTLIMGLIVVSAAVSAIALRRLKGGAKTAWQLGATAALVLGLAAIGVQIWELLSLPFFPGASGFASVFVGFCPVYVAVALAAMIWLETLVMGSLRLPAAWFAHPPHVTGDVVNLQRFQASLSSFTAVWNFLAAMAILAWILFYLVV
jgi:heme/copper-type cytochrome/quinol oxidase subunit 3